MCGVVLIIRCWPPLQDPMLFDAILIATSAACSSEEVLSSGFTSILRYESVLGNSWLCVSDMLDPSADPEPTDRSKDFNEVEVEQSESIR